MNRAILIVICDFIVSAMLSLFTGSAQVGTASGTRGAALDNRTAVMVLQEMRREQAELEKMRKSLLDEQYRQGFTGDRQRRLAELSDRLAEVTARAETLEKKTASTARETGAMTPEALQKQLEKEITSRYRLHLQKEETERALAELRRRNAEEVRKFAELDRTYRTLREEHASRGGQLELLKQQQAQKEKQLTEAGVALSKSREVIAARNADLQRSRNEIRVLEIARTTQAGKRREAESALAYTRGKLNATEQELAEAQTRSDRIAKKLADRNLELTEARRQLANVQKMLKNAVSDLSETRADLTRTREKSTRDARALAKASGELAAAKTMLATAEAKLRSDVQKQYSQAVVKLNMSMEETRLLIPQKRQGTYFLPVVKAGDRTCVIGELPNLTGNVRTRPDYSDLTALAYSVQPADGPGAEKQLAGPMYSLRQAPSVVLLEVNMPDRKPLKVLTMAELKQRGVQDLYLFKSSALGKESATLGGRCSMDKDYFYIRNTARGTGSELRAEPGDFVLTKQGEFVALVVSIHNSDLGRRQLARCVMMPDKLDWKAVTALPFRGADAMKIFNRTATPILKGIQAQARQADLQ